MTSEVRQNIFRDAVDFGAGILGRGERAEPLRLRRPTPQHPPRRRQPPKQRCSLPRFLIYFDEFSAYLSPRAKAIIAKAAKEAKAAGVKSITVQARASATGTVQTNKYLAMTRASIVADELEADGLDAATVQQQPIGQTGSRDPSVFNRRVDIVLHR